MLTKNNMFMKTNILFAIVMFLGISCGSPAPAGSEKTFILEETGVGSLRKDKPFMDMSQSPEGLYNRVEIDSFEDVSSGMIIQSYYFYYDDEYIGMFSVDDIDNPIPTLYFATPRVTLDNGVTVGDKLCDVLQKEGMKAYGTPDYLGESPININLYIVYRDAIYVGFDPETALKPEVLARAQQKLADMEDYDLKLEFTPDDFRPEAEVTVLQLMKSE